MSKPAVPRLLTLCLLLLPLPSQAVIGMPNVPLHQETTQRLVIKLHPDSQGRRQVMSPLRVQALTVHTGITFRHLRHTATGSDVFILPRRYGLAEAEMLARQLESLDSVEFAEPVYRRTAQRIPNDLDANQWYLMDKRIEPGSANLPAAWDISEGDSTLVIAVIDSGILPHPDLFGRTYAVDGKNYPYGYDFISVRPEDPVAFYTANDGNGRDPDPSDPGDGIDPADVTPDCAASLSSWHGTFVSGIIAATTNNGIGIAGINWQSKLLPVRVLGRCGGFTDDISDAIVWAAGGAVDGVPPNQHPARVINLSLGNPGDCSQTEQLAIDRARALGVVVLAATGNEQASRIDAPANCNGVIAVTASQWGGDLADFSNRGSAADIAAPGTFIYSTTNFGEVPGDYGYKMESGTSMSTPVVSGVVSLMLSANRALSGNWLPPATLESRLWRTADPFPSLSSCLDSGLCGVGLIDAAASVQAVSTPPVVSAGTDQRGPPGARITLSGSANSSDDSPHTFQWRQIGSTPYVIDLTDATSATTTFTLPSIPQGVVLEFRLTAGNELGLQASALVRVTVTNGPPLLTTMGDRTLTLNRRFTYRVTAEDPDGYILSADNLPAAAVFNPNTGRFDWTPATTGPYNVTFTATDNASPALASSRTVTLTVSKPPSGGGGVLGLLAFALLPACRKKWRGA